jgi:hypothetical protein
MWCDVYLCTVHWFACAEKECETFEASLAELKVWDAQIAGALAVAGGDACSPEEVVCTRSMHVHQWCAAILMLSL